MENLTKRQKEVYEYLKGYFREHDTAPSYEEIRWGLKVRSLATVHKHLKQLEKKGYLNSPWQSQKRAFSLVEMSGRAVTLPLLGMVAAGEPIEAIEAPEEVEVPESLLQGGECFALRVRGSSMIDEGIRDNDVILVKRQERAENGQTVVALVDDSEATVKKFFQKGKTIELRPANPDMEPIFMDAARVRIRGVVVGLLRSYK